MEDRLNKDNAMKSFLVGVHFDNVTPNNTLPKNIIVSTRADTTQNLNVKYLRICFPANICLGETQISVSSEGD